MVPAGHPPCFLLGRPHLTQPHRGHPKRCRALCSRGTSGGLKTRTICCLVLDALLALHYSVSNHLQCFVNSLADGAFRVILTLSSFESHPWLRYMHFWIKQLAFEPTLEVCYLLSAFVLRFMLLVPLVEVILSFTAGTCNASKAVSITLKANLENRNNPSSF